jgi:hypothetical protein
MLFSDCIQPWKYLAGDVLAKIMFTTPKNCFEFCKSFERWETKLFHSLNLKSTQQFTLYRILRLPQKYVPKLQDSTLYLEKSSENSSISCEAVVFSAITDERPVMHCVTYTSFTDSHKTTLFSRLAYRNCFDKRRSESQYIAFDTFGSRTKFPYDDLKSWAFHVQSSNCNASLERSIIIRYLDDSLVIMQPILNLSKVDHLDL